MKEKHIAVLDFGSQYMHLITRRIRQMGVKAVIYPTDVSADDLFDAWGVIISGGPNSVGDNALLFDPAIFELDIPVLGLCYGHQLMAHVLGGVVTPAHNREYGIATLETAGDSPLLKGLQTEEQVWMSHWDSVTVVPAGFSIIGTTKDCPVVMMANEKRHQYGLQFHPEVHHTKNGHLLLRNFVFDICGAEKNWSMEEYFSQLRASILEQVGDKNVFLFVSGGVDSSVAFALLEDILGKERVYGVHVDTGCMRLNESTLVQESLAEAGFDNVHVVDASQDFFDAIGDEVDPEKKRHAIGKTFLLVQEAVMKKLAFDPKEWILGQGTIYPDTIESGGTHTSDTIKTHHNRIDAIMDLIAEGRVIEPLAELYKDEVRELGKQLGLSDALIDRWPFPGPGLAIRTLCSDGALPKKERIEKIESEVQQITKESAAQVLPIKSVGVQGDQRSYEHPALLFAKRRDWKELSTLSVAITNGVIGINRVLLHVAGFSGKYQLAAKTMTKERIALLQQADAIVEKQIRSDHGAYDQIWQFPVILLPLETDTGEEVIVLRPIESQEAMTVNFYEMEDRLLNTIAEEILSIEGIGAVLYDITNKPPATIEWE